MKKIYPRIAWTSLAMKKAASEPMRNRARRQKGQAPPAEARFSGPEASERASFVPISRHFWPSWRIALPSIMGRQSNFRGARWASGFWRILS
jgi:hypothetical protein